MIFSNNKKGRRRTSQGNYAFRRKSARGGDIHRLELNPETAASRRASFRRRAGVGARWAFALLATIMFIALIKVVIMEAFVNNPRFRLQNIEVLGEGPLSASAITTASGLKSGENLLMISLRAVRDRLEALPEVRSARITRKFPGMIVLEVIQRVPVAWLECPDRAIAAKTTGYGCLLDDEGVVLPSSARAAIDTRQLPVIRVAQPPRIAPGQHLEWPAALAALKLLQFHQKTPLAKRLELARVDATKPHALVAEFTGGLRVTFPCDGPVEKEMSRLQRTLDEAGRRQWRLATINLLVQHNVPVTLRRSPETASSTSRAQHPVTIAEAR